MIASGRLWIYPTIAAFLTLAPPAIACKPGSERYFACTFSDGAKRVEVCVDAVTATYAFGPANADPELFLSRLVTQVHLTPWPGIGRTIWEEIIFENDGHHYILAPSITRIYPDNEDDEITAEISGALFVERDDQPLAELTCDENSVDFPWSTALYDAKEASGQCYDRSNRIWRSC